MQAIILAAGKGTRFGEITKKIPKSLILVAGKPIIEYALEALPSSVKEVYLVVGHLGEQIENHVGKEYKGIKIKYIELKNLTGTATAVWKAKKYLGKDKFLVLYGDDLYSKNELEKLIRYPWAFGLAKLIPPTPKYLNLVLDPKKYIIQALYPTKKEMKTGILVSTGAYVMDSRIFKYKPVKLANGEYGLPQTMLMVALPASRQEKNISIKGVIMKKWLQINSPGDINRAELVIKN